MFQYAAKSNEAIRAARLSLIAGLQKPRVSPVTKERMRVWITEAEAELVARFGDAIPAHAGRTEMPKSEPKLWEMKAGIREPQTVADQNKLQWAAWS